MTSHLVMVQEESGYLDVKTSRRPQTWVRITKAGVGTDKTTERTIRRQSTEIQQLRTVVSGGTRQTKQADEVLVLTKANQDKFLRQAGLKAKMSLAPGTALALKADMPLPWYRLRKLRHWPVAYLAVFTCRP